MNLADLNKSFAVKTISYMTQSAVAASAVQRDVWFVQLHRLGPVDTWAPQDLQTARECLFWLWAVFGGASCTPIHSGPGVLLKFAIQILRWSNAEK